MPASGGVSTAPPSRGDNRFYVSPAMRKYKKVERKSASRAPQSQSDKRTPARRDQPSSSNANCSVSDRAEIGSSGASSSSNSATNMDRFLLYTTPILPAQIPPKSAVARRNRGSHAQPHSFFILGDLWEFFKEWSVYGVGVPITLSDGEPVLQYYAPSLSGIQIYIDPQRHGHENKAGSSRAANENEKLVFQYLEHVSPFNREPLADKTAALASRFPQLETYKSCDLAPSSWVAVAWYPIYRIPMGLARSYLDACFLTFHSLSTPSSKDLDWRFVREVRLPTFGLACYKFKAWFWNPDENPKFGSLLEGANRWLRRLQVSLPDYVHFVTHGNDQR